MHFPPPNNVVVPSSGNQAHAEHGGSTIAARSDLRRIAVVTAAVLGALWLVSLAITVVALGSVAAPFASNCAAETIAFRPGTTVDTAMSVSGKRSCTLAVKPGPATIDQLSIETPSAQGRVHARGHRGVVYTPAQDFSGSDAFALTLTGKLNSERGTMLIRVTVSR